MDRPGVGQVARGLRTCVTLISICVTPGISRHLHLEGNNLVLIRSNVGTQFSTSYLRLSPQTFISLIFLPGLFLILPYRILLVVKVLGAIHETLCCSHLSQYISFISSLILHPHFLGIVSVSAFFEDLFLIFIYSSYSVLNQAHVFEAYIFHMLSVVFISSFLTLHSQPNFSVPFRWPSQHTSYSEYTFTTQYRYNSIKSEKKTTMPSFFINCGCCTE